MQLGDIVAIQTCDRLMAVGMERAKLLEFFSWQRNLCDSVWRCGAQNFHYEKGKTHRWRCVEGASWRIAGWVDVLIMQNFLVRQRDNSPKLV
jgi:hypothetical protein